MLRDLLLSLALVLGTGLPCRAAEPREWPLELRIRQFQIHCDFQLDSSRTLAAELDALSRDVEALLELSSAEETVHIVLFQTPEAYARYMRHYFPKLPQRRALFIQDRGPGMLFTHWHSDVRTDLRHEVTHALLHERATSLPLWLDEGLAEYFEVEEPRRFSANPYLAEVSQRSRQGLLPSLRHLEQASDLAEFSDAQYRDSWSWTHFMLHRSRATRELLVRYIQRCRSGEPQLEFSRQLAALFPDLEVEYQQHFASLKSA